MQRQLVDQAGEGSCLPVVLQADVEVVLGGADGVRLLADVLVAAAALVMRLPARTGRLVPVADGGGVLGAAGEREGVVGVHLPVEVEQHPLVRVQGDAHGHRDVVPAAPLQGGRRQVLQQRDARRPTAAQAQPAAVQPDPVVRQLGDDRLGSLRLLGRDPRFHGELARDAQLRALQHVAVVVAAVEPQRRAALAGNPHRPRQLGVVRPAVVGCHAALTLVEAPVRDRGVAPHRAHLGQLHAAVGGAEEARLQEGPEDPAALAGVILVVVAVVDRQQAAVGDLGELRVGEIGAQRALMVQHHLLVGDVPGRAVVERGGGDDAAVLALPIDRHQGAVGERDQIGLARHRRVPQRRHRGAPGAPVVGGGGLEVVLAVALGAHQHHQGAGDQGLGDLFLVGATEMGVGEALEAQPSQLHHLGVARQLGIRVALHQRGPHRRGKGGQPRLGRCRHAAAPKQLAVGHRQLRRRRVEVVAERRQGDPGAAVVLRVQRVSGGDLVALGARLLPRDAAPGPHPQGAVGGLHQVLGTAGVDRARQREDHPRIAPALPTVGRTGRYSTAEGAEGMGAGLAPHRQQAAVLQRAQQREEAAADVARRRLLKVRAGHVDALAARVLAQAHPLRHPVAEVGGAHPRVRRRRHRRRLPQQRHAAAPINAVTVPEPVAPDRSCVLHTHLPVSGG